VTNPSSSPSTASERPHRTVGAARSGRPRRWRPAHWRLHSWRLRTKLAAILVVPLVLVGTLGWARISASVRDAAELDRLVGQVAAGQQVAGLVDELQGERVLAEAYVAANRPHDRSGLDAKIGQVDAAAAAVTALPPARFGPAAGDITAAARVRLADLPALRRAVTGSAIPAERVGATYTSIIEVQLAPESAAFSAAPAPLVRAAADAGILAAAKEYVRRQHATLAAVLVGGSATPGLQDAARAADAQLAATLAELDTAALPATRNRYAETVAGADVDNRQRIEQRTLTAMNRDEPVPAGSDAAREWDVAAGRTAALIRDVELAHQQQLAADGAALAANARAAALAETVIVLALVLLTVLVLVLVARSLARPLRTLRTSAFQIARSRLPAEIQRISLVDGRVPHLQVTPIPVDTDEEVGEVARAFDAVHTAAVRLAGEQALLRRSVSDTFVHLAQRSEELVARQLHLIDELKQRGQNSHHLRELFKLDHIASRMRRNNENLLVLAGESERRGRHASDTTVGDVLAAAVAEIELQRMVAVGRVPEAVIDGATAADLAHLLAELLENATTFAPLDTKVTLDAWLRSDDDLVVEIVDEGGGLDPSELAKINAELAEPPLFDPTVSYHMGLFVVGRLAKRHGVTVELRRRDAGGGVAASVVVPASVLRHPRDAASGMAGEAARLSLAGAAAPAAPRRHRP
jgi:signal transduction histidine kinase